MPTRRLSITIPQPCHEDWASMAPEFQGRFCQNCQKTVVDFTAMTDAEMMEWVGQKQGNTCGRFRENQLNRDLISISPIRQYWAWKAVALGFTAWLSTKTAEAKDSVFPLITEQQSQTAPIKQAHTLKTGQSSDSLLVVKGVVLDAQTKEGMTGTIVHLKGTTIATSTDVNGNFSLNIPEELFVKDLTVEFSFIGYMNCEKKTSELQATPLATIKMSPDMKGLFETVVVGGYHTNKFSPRNIFHKMKNLFR